MTDITTENIAAELNLEAVPADERPEVLSDALTELMKAGAELGLDWAAACRLAVLNTLCETGVTSGAEGKGCEITAYAGEHWMLESESGSPSRLSSSRLGLNVELTEPRLTSTGPFDDDAESVGRTIKEWCESEGYDGRIVVQVVSANDGVSISFGTAHPTKGTFWKLIESTRCEGQDMKSIPISIYVKDVAAAAGKNITIWSYGS